MVFANEFSFVIDENYKLPNYILGEQFFSYFNVKTEQINNNHNIYKISCSIERDYYMNNYRFYLKYNKENDYYILNDINGNTIDYVNDLENDYSTIEEPIINNILINICGHIPKLYFGDILNSIYSKINKYLINRLEKLSKRFKEEIRDCVENSNCEITFDDIKKLDYDLYCRIQNAFIMLFIHLDNKVFVINSVSYKIKNLSLQNVLINSNFKFKIPKKNLKINNVEYLY